MLVSKRELEERKQLLLQRQQQLLVARDQLVADLNAHAGAIQEVDYWLAQLEVSAEVVSFEREG